MQFTEVALRTDKRGQPASQGSRETPAAEWQDETDSFEQWYVCRHCRRRIAPDGWQINIQGKHRHVFANASGIIFEIACFSSARGYSFAGNPSTDFSWFTGYAWRIILCAGCQNHLGWMFSAHSGDVFFGLITDAVVREKPPKLS